MLLGNTGRSLYNSLQLSLAKRMSRRRAVQPRLHLLAVEGHELGRSRAAPPAAASRTSPNAGFVVQGNQRDLDANYALSDFDRPHRFSGSWVWDLPGQGRARRLPLLGLRADAVRVCRIRSTRPNPSSATSASTATWFADPAGSIASASAGRACAARSTSCASTATIPTEAAFNKSVLCSPTTAAGGYPGNQGFGNLGRNVLRGFWQRRVDLSLAKSFRFAGERNVELRWDVFNVFNTVNYALPNNVIGSASTDFGKITDSVGGPRVMQLGARVRF